MHANEDRTNNARGAAKRERGAAACKHHDDVSEVEEAAEPTKFWAVRSLPNTALAQHLRGTAKEGLQ